MVVGGKFSHHTILKHFKFRPLSPFIEVFFCLWQEVFLQYFLFQFYLKSKDYYWSDTWNQKCKDHYWQGAYFETSIIRNTVMIIAGPVLKHELSKIYHDFIFLSFGLFWDIATTVPPKFANPLSPHFLCRLCTFWLFDMVVSIHCFINFCQSISRWNNIIELYWKTYN